MLEKLISIVAEQLHVEEAEIKRRQISKRISARIPWICLSW